MRLVLAALLSWALLLPAFSHAQPRESTRSSSRRETSRPDRIPANVERLDSLAGITQYRLKSNGMTILVAETPRSTAASFYLRNPNEIYEFLQQLIRWWTNK